MGFLYGILGDTRGVMQLWGEQNTLLVKDDKKR